MTTTAKEWTPTPADFDDWDETKEKEALAIVAENTKVRHIIKNSEYWALAPGGAIYKLPLYLSISDFEKLSAAETDAESIEQVKLILTAFAGEEQARKLEHEPHQVAINLLMDYGATLAKTQGADLGKSVDSSNSSTPKTE